MVDIAFETEAIPLRGYVDPGFLRPASEILRRRVQHGEQARLLQVLQAERQRAHAHGPRHVVDVTNRFFLSKRNRSSS